MQRTFFTRKCICSGWQKVSALWVRDRMRSLLLDRRRDLCVFEFHRVAHHSNRITVARTAYSEKSDGSSKNDSGGSEGGGSVSEESEGESGG